MTDSGSGEASAPRGDSTRGNVIDIRAWAQESSRRRHPSTWAADSPPSTITDHSPDALWRADFEIHANQHADATTSGMWVLAPVVEAALRRSLPVFQLGEAGAGFHLLNSARGVVSDDLASALRLFVLEEQEHARIHALICASLDIEMLEDHWSDRVFRAARRIRGFRTEILLMGVADVITAEVYDTLAAGVGDPTLSRLFARMHADELRHLDFQASVLPQHLRRMPRSLRRLTGSVWNVIAQLAIVAVAIEHRALFRACGASSRSFIRHAGDAARAHAVRLFAS